MKEALRVSTRSLLLAVLILTSSALQSLAYYHPDEGRWLSRDPIGAEGGPNLATFVRNAPISLVDSVGLEECELQSHFEYIRHPVLADRDMWTLGTITATVEVWVGPLSETRSYTEDYRGSGVSP